MFDFTPDPLDEETIRKGDRNAIICALVIAAVCALIYLTISHDIAAPWSPIGEAPTEPPKRPAPTEGIAA